MYLRVQVLIVTTFFPNAAKPQRSVFVRNLVQAMKRHCDVEVIAPVPYAPPFGIRPEWRVQKLIPSHETVDGIDVRHPRFAVVPKLGLFSGLSYFLGVVSTIRRHIKEGNRPVVHVHCAYPDAVGVALAARLLKLPYVVTTHGSDINVYAEQSALRFQIRWALRHALGIVAVSAALENKIGRLLGNAKPRIACIPCAAFNPQVFFPRPTTEARRSLEIAQEARVVIFVGLLVPIKGIRFLIDAWSELNRRGKLSETDRLVLLGDGPERDALERRISESGIAGKVLFAGTVDQTVVSKWMSAANLLCLPSLNEGTPNVIVEALASGIPVVASRVGGIPDLIRESENGALVAATDTMALAEALDRVLARNWDAQKIADSVAHLNWQAIAERNCEFIQSLL